MQSLVKSGVAGALSAVLALTLAPSESFAGPTSVADKSIVGLSSPIDQVHYRRYHHHHNVRHRRIHRHYRHYYRYGYDPAAAIFGAAAAGLLAAGTYGAYYNYPHYGYGWGYPYYSYGWGAPVYWGGGYGYRRVWGHGGWGGGWGHRWGHVGWGHGGLGHHGWGHHGWGGGHFGGFHGGFHRRH